MDPLKISARDREYKCYAPNIRGQVAYIFLRDKKIGHRTIDERYLGKNPKSTRGYEAMGILHYQGIVQVHHGKCPGMQIDDIIAEFTNDPDSGRLIRDLTAYKTNTAVELKQRDQIFQAAVEKALKDQSSERQKRLKNYDGKPQKIQIASYGFNRSPDVVAEALLKSEW